MRTQPAGFRWLVGGFAVLAAIAFGFRYLAEDDRPSLLFALICLAVAGYWLLFDRDDGGLDPDQDSSQAEWQHPENG
ncbi:MAG: hypothetical protein ABI140_01230 [Jatrophihabitantaceae bacterium]